MFYECLNNASSIYTIYKMYNMTDPLYITLNILNPKTIKRKGNNEYGSLVLKHTFNANPKRLK